MEAMEDSRSSRPSVLPPEDTIPEIQIIPQNYPQIALILIDLTCNFLNEHLEKRASESQQFIFGWLLKLLNGTICLAGEQGHCPLEVILHKTSTLHLQIQMQTVRHWWNRIGQLHLKSEEKFLQKFRNIFERRKIFFWHGRLKIDYKCVRGSRVRVWCVTLLY